jgi:hypothetical protein
LAPAAPPESEGWQRDEDAGRNRSGLFLPDFEGREKEGRGWFFGLALPLTLVVEQAFLTRIQASGEPSFHITPEDRQALPRHLQALALAMGGPFPSSSVLRLLI